MSTEKIIDIMMVAIAGHFGEHDHPRNAAREALTALQSSGYMVIEVETPRIVGTCCFCGRELNVHDGRSVEPEDTVRCWPSCPPQAQGEIEERSDTDSAEQPGASLTQKSGLGDSE